MISLDDLHAFVRVAETGSFTTAGVALDVPKSTVSRRVHRLEEALGAQLLNRTTRAVRLTDLGRVLFERYARSITDLTGVEQVVADEAEEPSGTLRVSFPGDLGTLFAGELAAGFKAKHPKVRLEVGVTDRLLDLVEEGGDVAVRVYGNGAPDSASLIGRRLGKLGGRLFASADYLDQHGRPSEPAQLAEHELVLFAQGRPRPITLRRVSDGATTKVATRRGLLSDNFFVVRDAIRAGAGVGWLPDFIVDDRLEPVLGDWRDDMAELWIVWPVARHVSPSVRAFVDHVVDQLPSRTCDPGEPGEPRVARAAS